MSTNDKDQNKTSRLTKHLHLMGVEPTSGLKPGELSQEKQLMDAVGDMPPLDFDKAEVRHPKPIRPSHWFAAGLGVAAAATMTFYVMQPRERVDLGPGLRVKGDIGAATVYFDHEGKVGKLTSGMTLESGTKVRVEVSAHGDAFAYMTVADRNSQLLTDATGLRLALKAGEKASFPGALELTGESEGETILVLICPAAAEAGVAATDVAAAFQTRQMDGALAPCKLEAVPLR